MVFFCLFCPPQKQVVNHHQDDDDSNSIMIHNRNNNNNLVVVETQPNHQYQHQHQHQHQHQQQKHIFGFINGEKANKHARVSSLTPSINTMATTPTASSLSWPTKQQGGGGGGEISSLTSPTHSRTKQTIIRTVDTVDSVLTEEEDEEPLAGESIHHHHHHHDDQDQGSLSLTTYEKLETYLENLHEDTCLNDVSSHRDMMNNDETTPKSFLLPSPQSDTGSILVLTTDSKWFPPHQLQTRETQEQESSSPMIVQKDPHPTNRIRSASAAWSSSSSASSNGSSSSTGNRDNREDRRDSIEHELSVIVQACVDNKEFVHEFEDEAIEALGIAAMKVAYADGGEGLSIAYSILYGRLLEVASRHYFGKFDDFIVAYSPVLRSSIQRLKNNLVTDAKYYDNNYTYVRSIDNNIMSESSQFRSTTTTTELVFRDHSNFWELP